jgi:LytR cell envelope-related transcriptional attenuator
MPQSDMSVLVGNASGTFNLAARTRLALLDMGYPFVSSTVGLSPSSTSTIFFAPGLEGEAQRLAREIGAPANLVTARPAEPVVRADQEFDVLILLGDDWDEVTDLESVVPDQVAPPDSIN